MSATTDPTLKKERKEKKEKKERKEKKDKDSSNRKRKATAITTEIEEVAPAIQSPEPVTEPSSALVASDQSEPTSDVEASDKERPAKKRKASVDVLEVDLSLPVPPSKKELRRMKKGKPVAPKKPENRSENTPEPEEKKKPEQEKRSEHGIWIGNLPWSASKDDLRKFFTDNSDITEDAITRIHMPGPNDGKSANKVEERKFGKKVENKGFAYVDFATAEDVQHAVELSEQLITGRRVLIKNAKSFEGRPEKTKEEQRNDGKPPSKRIFLGNLTFDTTEESLKDHFEKCGAIESVKVATFEDSGKCKGYAWIVFEELEAAESAVKGFVRIEEPISDAEESESDADSDAEESKPKKKQTKTRKWWVNKIKGRPLRMEFAEDAQVRYKKRYGSGGTKNPAAGGVDGEARDANSTERGPRPERPRYEKPVKKVEYRSEYAPRLTGGIVESKGTKTTF